MSNSAQDVLSVLHQLLLPTPNRNRLNIRQVRVWLNILSDALNLNETHKLLNVHFLSTPTTPWSGRYVALCVIRLSLVVNVCQTSGTRASFWLTVGLSPPPPTGTTVMLVNDLFIASVLFYDTRMFIDLFNMKKLWKLEISWIIIFLELWPFFYDRKESINYLFYVWLKLAVTKGIILPLCWQARASWPNKIQ